MSKRFMLKFAAIILVCLVVFTGCSSTSQNDNKAVQTKKGEVTDGNAADALTITQEVVTTTTIPDAVTTTGSHTTTSTTGTVKDTSVQTTTTTATTTKAPIPAAQTVPAEERISFERGSEDYTVFEKYIEKYFPEEKHFDEFEAKLVDVTDKSYKGFRVIFNRWINGCQTESYYVFYFNTEGNANGDFVELSYRSFEYDPSKVKPPRIATEEEIEAAKKAEAEKVPEGFFLSSQVVEYSDYDISRDENYFIVRTYYINKKAQEVYDAATDPSDPFYGKTPPIEVMKGTYTIER